jgi:adenine-specific DNA-methyltransferase
VAPERRRGGRAAGVPSTPITFAPAAAARVPAVQSEQAAGTVRVTAAKGRPMLVWVGKRPLSHVTAFPAQAAERFAAREQTVSSEANWQDWPAAYPPGGLLFHGDNKEVLAHLLANDFRGKVNLIYIDPPFDSGADYVRKVSLRGATGSAKIHGEQYTLGEQIQYTDIWANDNYLQFMYERLLLLKELLSPSGSIWIHCDPQRGHHLRCLSDEVFGAEQFVNQVAWKRSDAHSDVGQGATHFGAIHDTLLLYGKSGQATWNEIFTPLPLSTVESWYRYVEPETRRRYNKADITAPGGPAKGNPVYEWKGITRAWRYSKAKMEDLERRGLLVYSETGMSYRKRYLDESKGVPLQDWWDDIQMLRGIQRREQALYPTEKPEPLLDRILRVSSKPGDLVLDCFIGSGTTAAVAQKLGRRWIACDINKGAIQTTAKRLQAIVREQVEQAQQRAAAGEQGNLLGEEPGKEQPAAPAQLSFSVWRVNDYDLQIQHNEAVALACEHIGVQRTRTDSFFDGTLGKRLVKIIPFDHPLSPADLEELRRELDGRPDEDREITLVCLGMEIAAKAWIDDWNRLRKGRNAANKVHVIELRTDQKYGRFIRHEPARASVKIQRRNGRLCIAIDEFISPGIIERLRQQAGVLQPMIEDWRSMVDCVMVDPAWDGRVFNVALSDIPERRTDLVQGNYDLPAPPGETTVAVKIIDMLGEEVIVTSQV